MYTAILTLLLTLPPLAPVSPPDGPEDVQRPPVESYYCCDWVDPKGNDGAGTGGGCVKITEDAVNGCDHWLECPGGATGSDGVVTCTATKK